MISLIITGHGHFASGLFSAVEQVIGPQEQCIAVDFPPEMSTQQLDEKLTQVLASLPQQDGVLFFTDLLGGSPFRSSVLLSQILEHSDVVAGTNMQMLAEMLMERDDISSTETFVTQALACGQQGMLSFKQKQRETTPSLSSDEDGI
ncbi:PTS galactosamine/N-acetylgalactosamine transporter subunit IIA [Hafnia alvei]|uniref:PTS N-acetylgalactosamine transporter subunit IIA n=1 Tax=Hafnia alvei FB1 TaxID=1453496 RepID=A0A097QXY4_HAFAL|nr:PTS galactosamine/N-acetylgalactosamine transporter subunit IIA [Hafnia alvei]AIU71348.1 PTS N-acetylgalactosamine transporter subunit IIA [Hafnia alvei FB1]TBL61491.1 PTS sugar transporter subunit IIA [Hafnia alvei]TBM19357.1 PTS sugar transporter subunit IIA [Hafnia alvei]